jgi:hypothetical protein
VRYRRAETQRLAALSRGAESIKGSGVLTHRHSKSGQLKCALDLSSLYPTKDARKRFRRRFAEFINSDPHVKKVYALKDDRLIFRSEQLMPKKTDKRTPMLLVFGNPAPRSAIEGMLFSFEGNGKEHRFWKHILEGSGIINFRLGNSLTVRERNIERKRQLLALNYASHFRVGLCAFLSLPSGASGPWSGVVGMRRLLGAEAMRRVMDDERARIIECAREFSSRGGIVVTFQRTAWEGLRSEETRHMIST